MREFVAREQPQRNARSRCGGKRRWARNGGCTAWCTTSKRPGGWASWREGAEGPVRGCTGKFRGAGPCQIGRRCQNAAKVANNGTKRRNSHDDTAITIRRAARGWFRACCTVSLDGTGMHLEYVLDQGSELPLHYSGIVESLKIWHCKFKSLDTLPAFSKLRSLVIGGFPLESFSILEELPLLRELRVVHFPRVSDIDALGSLRELEMLSLSALPDWNALHERQRVASLAPLGKLHKLRVIDLFGVVPDVGGLLPLGACRHLTQMQLLGYSATDKAALQQALPRLSIKGA